MENKEGRALGWDDEIENDGEDFTMIPEGDYSFEVAKFERARFNGSDKMPACNKAVLGIEIIDEDGKTLTTINHNLLLHSRSEWQICQFFRSIGARSHGEKVKMDWNNVVGKQGRCKVIHKKQKSNKDASKEVVFVNIAKFYDPDNAPAKEVKQGEF